MKKFGLIGYPIAHSLSPALFKAGYGGKYPYDLIETPDFEEAYRQFIEAYDGINVTAPFKELAFAKADILSDECKDVRATNLLVKTPEGVKACNSDYLGVRMWLQEKSDMLSACVKNAAAMNAGEERLCTDGTYRPVKTLIAGLGGAGKAAAAAAESLGMEVMRMNRTIKDNSTLPLDDFRECFREADIIIYNIPTAIPVLNELTENDFTSGKPKYIMEANYKNPSFDESLIQRMKKADPMVEYTGGRIWLLYQAMTGYEIFTGEKPDFTKMTDVL